MVPTAVHCVSVAFQQQRCDVPTAVRCHCAATHTRFLTQTKLRSSVSVLGRAKVCTELRTRSKMAWDNYIDGKVIDHIMVSEDGEERGTMEIESKGERMKKGII